MNTESKRKSISVDELIELEKQEEKEKSFYENDTNDSISDEQDKEKQRRENKFYLPVLNLNDSTMWESQPVSKRRYLTDEVAKEVCLGNCCGVPGLKASCCKMDPDDLEHVLGPISEKCISRIIKRFKKKGINLRREDVVIDYEEGRLIGDKLFNGHPIFDKKESYPILRFQAIGPRYGCKFLNAETGMCNIYEFRPQMCEDYYCQYIKKNFLLRSKQHPNTYKRVDVEKEKGKDEENADG